VIFSDATHSKEDPQHYTLDFHESPSVGENGESLTTRPPWLKRKNDVSSALLKKEGKLKKRDKKVLKRKEKNERKREEQVRPT
jgi:hypothetical protein